MKLEGGREKTWVEWGNLWGWSGGICGVGVGEFVGLEWGNLWGWSGERSSEGREIPEWEGKHGESNDGQVEVEKREREER